MKKGFTLIELLAVIALLAIIALIGTPVIIGVFETSREKAYNLEVENISREINIRKLDSGFSMNGTYTKEQVKNLLGMEIKGDSIVVTQVDDIYYVLMVKEGKRYYSDVSKFPD